MGCDGLHRKQRLSVRSIVLLIEFSAGQLRRPPLSIRESGGGRHHNSPQPEREFSSDSLTVRSDCFEVPFTLPSIGHSFLRPNSQAPVDHWLHVELEHGFGLVRHSSPSSALFTARASSRHSCLISSSVVSQVMGHIVGPWFRSQITFATRSTVSSSAAGHVDASHQCGFRERRAGCLSDPGALGFGVHWRILQPSHRD